MENKSRKKLEKNLYSDLNDLVREGNDGEGFLKSLTDLVESEKYRNITSELDDDEDDFVSEKQKPAFRKSHKPEADMVEADDLEEIMAVISGKSLIQEAETPLDSAEKKLHEKIGKSDEKSKTASKTKSSSVASDSTSALDNYDSTSISDTSDSTSSTDGGDSNTPSDSGDSTPPSDGGDHTPPKKKKKNKWVYDLIMVACIGVFVYCIGRIGYYYYMGYKYNKSNKGIQDMVGDISQKIVTKTPETIIDTDIYFPDELVYASTNNDTPEFVDDVTDDWKQKYASLVEHNPDCVGYIQIPDTKINYPVMYTPGDYEKYLYKDFEGNYQFRGLPFMAEYTLLNRSQNYIIYGHNMNDGSAFGNLKKYLYKKWADEHPYCYFNTAYSEGVYQVMAVVLTKIYNVEDECFKYYKYVGELSEEDFNTYVYYMKKMSQYDTGVDAVWGDQLLSLSTCHRVHDPEGRLVVVFKRVQ